MQVGPQIVVRRFRPGAREASSADEDRRPRRVRGWYVPVADQVAAFGRSLTSSTRTASADESLVMKRPFSIQISRSCRKPPRRELHAARQSVAALRCASSAARQAAAAVDERQARSWPRHRCPRNNRPHACRRRLMGPLPEVKVHAVDEAPARCRCRSAVIASASASPNWPPNRGSRASHSSGACTRMPTRQLLLDADRQQCIHLAHRIEMDPQPGNSVSRQPAVLGDTVHQHLIDGAPSFETVGSSLSLTTSMPPPGASHWRASASSGCVLNDNHDRTGHGAASASRRSSAPRIGAHADT